MVLTELKGKELVHIAVGVSAVVAQRLEGSLAHTAFHALYEFGPEIRLEVKMATVHFKHGA